MSFKLICPPVESNVRFPDEVSIVFAVLPILTVLAVMLPVPTERAFVDGL